MGSTQMTTRCSKDRTPGPGLTARCTELLTSGVRASAGAGKASRSESPYLVNDEIGKPAATGWENTSFICVQGGQRLRIPVEADGAGRAQADGDVHALGECLRGELEGDRSVDVGGRPHPPGEWSAEVAQVEEDLVPDTPTPVARVRPVRGERQSATLEPLARRDAAEAEVGAEVQELAGVPERGLALLEQGDEALDLVGRSEHEAPTSVRMATNASPVHTVRGPTRMS